MCLILNSDQGGIVLAKLDEVMSALHGDSGDLQAGLPLSHAWEVGVAKYLKSPDRKIRIVGSWIWLDVLVAESDAEKIDADGFMPAFLYSHRLVHDFSGDFKADSWTCSSLMRKGSSPATSVVESRGSIYILTGKGHRRTVRPEVIRSIALRARMLRKIGCMAADS